MYKRYTQGRYTFYGWTDKQGRWELGPFCVEVSR